MEIDTFRQLSSAYVSYDGFLKIAIEIYWSTWWNQIHFVALLLASWEVWEVAWDGIRAPGIGTKMLTGAAGVIAVVIVLRFLIGGLIGLVLIGVSVVGLVTVYVRNHWRIWAQQERYWKLLGDYRAKYDRIRADWIEGRIDTTTLALRSTCTDHPNEIECHTDHPTEIRHRTLPTNTYFMIVTNYDADEIVLDVQFSDPTEPPANETYTAPIDMSTSNTFHSSIMDVVNDLSATCPHSFTSLPDLIYTFTTTEKHNVRISATTPTNKSISQEIRPTYDSTIDTIRCTYGAPTSGHVHQLPASTYFLMVESPNYTEVDFQLDVELLTPTPTAMDNSCDTAIPLALKVRTTSSLVDLEDDIDTTYDFHYQKVIYSFTLAERHDVLVEIDARTSYFTTSLRPTYTNSKTQLRYTNSAPVRQQMRDLPTSTYYMMIESPRTSDFAITMTNNAPTPTMMVNDNDTYESAHMIPTTDEFFVENTTTMVNDYTTATYGFIAQSNNIAFHVDLTTRHRMVASTKKSTFDTMLHLHDTSYRNSDNTFCSDNSDNSWNLIDQTLDPNTYFLVVDNYSTATAGNYALKIQITDPT